MLQAEGFKFICVLLKLPLSVCFGQWKFFFGLNAAHSNFSSSFSLNVFYSVCFSQQTGFNTPEN